jgi:hypothetical protein
MRYYQIVISDPKTGKVVQPFSNGSVSTNYTYTSYANGQVLSAALDVEFDIPVVAFHVPDGAAYVKVWGVSLQEISQSSNLNGMNITVSGGFQKGLPLANPKQAGILVQGSILQAFGNWVNTDMSLDLIVAPPFGNPVETANLTLNWQAGGAIQSAIQQSLATAYPDYTSTFSISPNLVRPNAEVGFYGNLSQFATYVNDTTRPILGGSYGGANITVTGKTFNVFDGTQQTNSSQNPTQVLFQELVGQPTWIDPATLQFRCPMRSDLKLGDFVKMPQGIPTITTQQAASNLTNLKANFQGTFMVTKVRHTGHFRQPSADAWVTIIDAATTPNPIAVT